jgi:hypothetical protein
MTTRPEVKSYDESFLFMHVRADEERCLGGQDHDFKGWQEFDGGRGGTTVCTRCGLSAFEHSLRYAP